MRSEIWIICTIRFQDQFHSIPVYEEMDAPVGMKTAGVGVNIGQSSQKVQRMLGVLLVKQLVLLDPKGEHTYAHLLPRSLTFHIQTQFLFAIYS